MFTPDNLSALWSATASPGVSIYLPTQVHGRETRQGSIRLKNLLREAQAQLTAAGATGAEAEALLAPAAALIDDHSFWQYQGDGLALFLNAEGLHTYKLPLPVIERVVVGEGFWVRPLLPLMAADGAFEVLSVTAGSVRLHQASRFSLVEIDSTGLPTSLTEEWQEDYENPVQASPIARPHTGSIDISNAQVYGDSPTDWSKNRLVESVRKLAAAVDDRSAPRPIPLVLIADAEISGHFRKVTSLGPLLTGAVETNPEALDKHQVHEAAYAVARPHLDADRQGALQQFRSSRGSDDGRAAVGVESVVRAAAHGRVGTLLLPATEEPVWGRYDEATDEVSTDVPTGKSGDLVDLAAELTLQHGGRIHVMDPDDENATPVAALLRY